MTSDYDEKVLSQSDIDALLSTVPQNQPVPTKAATEQQLEQTTPAKESPSVPASASQEGSLETGSANDIESLQATVTDLMKRLGKIEAALDKIRPALQADGGDVELVDVNEGVVKLMLKGACGGCPMATMTLRNGIERVLREEVPEVKEVIAI